MTTFGLACSQDIFQKQMEQILEQCNGCIGISDDVTVHGWTEEEHDRCLHTLMKMAHANGLVFNSANTLIKAPSVNFFSCLYDKDGIYPDPAKVADIKNMPAPVNVTQLQQFLGRAMYMSPFILDFSTQTALLWELLKRTLTSSGMTHMMLLSRRWKMPSQTWLCTTLIPIRQWLYRLMHPWMDLVLPSSKKGDLLHLLAKHWLALNAAMPTLSRKCVLFSLVLNASTHVSVVATSRSNQTTTLGSYLNQELGWHTCQTTMDAPASLRIWLPVGVQNWQRNSPCWYAIKIQQSTWWWDPTWYYHPCHQHQWGSKEWLPTWDHHKYRDDSSGGADLERLVGYYQGCAIATLTILVMQGFTHYQTWPPSQRWCPPDSTWAEKLIVEDITLVTLRHLTG